MFWLVPLASGIAQRNTPFVIVALLRLNLTAPCTWLLLNGVVDDDTGIPSGRYYSPDTLESQHPGLGVRQYRPGPVNLLPMSTECH